MKTSGFVRFLVRGSTAGLILLVTGIVVAFQMYHFHNYNNYLIFRYSYPHLVHWVNLYVYHNNEHHDAYLYSPGFAILMAPLSYLHDWAGLLIWSLLSCVMFYVSIRMLPFLDDRQKAFLFLIILIEFITSIQNMQTNAIIVSCMVLAFACFEREKLFWAAFFIILSASIKVFGLAAAAMFLLYPRKDKFIMYMAFWAAVFIIAPILFIPPKQFAWQYHNWFDSITGIHKSEDAGIPHNYHPPLSVMGWLKTWWQVNIPGLYFQLAGVLLLLAPLLRTGLYSSPRYKLFLLASILIFCVIFNHIAESPTFVIAVYGAAIWFVVEKKNIIVWLLLTYMILFTVLSATDIFPAGFRTDYVIPYVLKAVPCIFIWFYLQGRLLFSGKKVFASSLHPVEH